jgi:hypothetical protein
LPASLSSRDVILHCPTCLRERGNMIYYSPRQKHCAVCDSEALEPLDFGESGPPLPAIGEVLADFAASHWIKHSLSSALTRDPVDAANDAGLLARLLDKKCRDAFSGS